MKKVLAIAAIFLMVGSQSAQAATKVTVTNLKKISTKDGLVTIKVSNLPKTNGIYISQCMAIKKGETAPTACNPAEGSKLWISNVPADIEMGAKPGKGILKLKVDKYFENGDCIHTKCVLFVTNDHNASSDRSEDQAIQFKFSGINLF
ncbi:MAG: hypothetical protein RLY79_266 [Actinomycetota bacterium]|jgi:hypothetical protein